MANPNTSQGALNLKTQAHELTKQHIVLDGTNRITDVYTAGRMVTNGGPCTRTRYQYAGPTSSYVTGMMEDLDAWQTAWEF